MVFFFFCGGVVDVESNFSPCVFFSLPSSSRLTALELNYSSSHVPLLPQTAPPSLSAPPQTPPHWPRIRSSINLSSFFFYQTSHVGLLPSPPTIPSSIPPQLLSFVLINISDATAKSSPFCRTDINHLDVEASQRGIAGPVRLWRVNKRP